MPQTLDPGDFDIHEFEDQKPKVFPVTEKERIDPRTLKGINEAEYGFKPKKRIFLAIVGNLFLPGLGNIIIGKSPLSKALLAANIALLAAALSPTSFLGFLGNMAYPRIPPAFIAGIRIVPLETAGNAVIIGLQTQLLFQTSVLLAVLAWIHLLYLFFRRNPR